MQYLWIAIAWLMLIQSTHASNSLAQKRAKLEQALLQRNSEQNITGQMAYIPLKINGRVHDDIYFKTDQQQAAFIKKKAFDYIATQIKEEHRSSWVSPKAEGAEGLVPLKALEQMGIEAFYDEYDVAIAVEIPLEIKVPTSLLARSRNNRNKEGAILSEKISGGMNLYLNQQYYKSDIRSLQASDISASSDLFLNVYDFVLEGRLNYDADENKVHLGQYRLLKDDVDRQFRYTLGYISLPTQSRLSSLNVMGASFEKRFTIGDSFTQNMTRRNSNEFYLQYNSHIEIYINDRYERAIDLASGPYSLEDLQLQTGLNTIKLKIIEEGGKVEYMEFNDFSYGNILAKGEIQYGIGAGYESDMRDNEPAYDTDKKVASGYVEYGLLDALTVETGVQVAEAYSAASIEAMWGTPYGLVNPYIAITDHDTEGKGYKKGVQLRTNIGPVNLGFSYEKTDKNFHGYTFYDRYDRDLYGIFPLMDRNESVESERYQINLNTAIGYGVWMVLSASSYSKNDQKETRYGAKFSKTFGPNLRAELELERIDGFDAYTNNRILFTLSYRFQKDDQDYGISYDTDINENRHALNMQYTSPGQYGVDADAGITHNENANNYHAGIGFTDEKFILNTSYNYSDQTSSDRSNQSYSMQLATGMVFAGMKATVTAPVHASFVIVDNDDRLKKPLGIVGQQEQDAFTYDTYAVGLSDYALRDMTIDESNLDFGMDIKYLTNKFYTSYKSGSVLNIEVDNFYAVQGTFYDKKTKKAVQKKAFKVFNTTTGERTMGFTDEQGAFTINHLDKGQYNITFVHEAGYADVARCTFEIKKENQESLIHIGNIYLDMPTKRLGVDMIFDAEQD